MDLWAHLARRLATLPAIADDTGKLTVETKVGRAILPSYPPSLKDYLSVGQRRSSWRSGPLMKRTFVIFDIFQWKINGQ